MVNRSISGYVVQIVTAIPQLQEEDTGRANDVLKDYTLGGGGCEELHPFLDCNLDSRRLGTACWKRYCAGPGHEHNGSVLTVCYCNHDPLHCRLRHSG